MRRPLNVARDSASAPRGLGGGEQLVRFEPPQPAFWYAIATRSEPAREKRRARLSRRRLRSYALATMNWLYLGVAIVGEVIATSALKSSESFTKLVPSVAVIVGYGIAFYCLSLSLRTVPVGVAYAIWSGVGTVLVTALAWLIYGQKLDAWAFVGMALIVSGAAVLNLLSKMNAH